MNEITEFSFEGKNVRIDIQDGEIKGYVATDVCKCLGLDQTSRAVSIIPVDEKYTLTDRKGIAKDDRAQQIILVNEPGLYRLIFKSRKPEAERFKNWVFKEVLPSIRKHGAYLTDSVAERVASNPQTVYEIAEALVSERQRRNQLERRENIFGNRTQYGTISERTGQPRIQPVRGYLRSASNGALEFVPDAIQLDLFGC